MMFVHPTPESYISAILLSNSHCASWYVMVINLKKLGDDEEGEESLYKRIMICVPPKKPLS